MAANQAEFYAIDFSEVWLVGHKTTVQLGKTAARFIKRIRTDGTVAKLCDLYGRISPYGDIAIWMGEYDDAAKSFTEVAGVFVEPDVEVDDACDIRIIPACTMGIYVIRGKSRNLTAGAHNKLVKLMSGQGYIPDYSHGFSMEYYSYEKYEKDNDIYEFRYMLPCKKK